jgi:hypothetical protein
MVVNCPPNPSATFSMNAARDFMFCMKNAGNGAAAQDIELLLKAPTALTRAELAGTWKMVAFGAPAELVLQKDPLYNLYVTNVVGTTDFHVSTGTLTAAADGTLVLNNNGNVIPGTFQVVGAGGVDATMNIPMMGSFTLHFFINQGKNVMAAINPMDPASKEVIILVKQPASASTADFKGLWRAGSFVTPARLTVDSNFRGLVLNIRESNGFRFSLGDFAVGHTGSFTSPSELSVGRVNLTPPGTIQCAATNASGEVNYDTFWANSGKDFLITVNASGDQRVTIAVRAPAENVRRESMTMVLLNSTVSWASDTSRQLEFSTNLTQWAALTNTTGQSSYSISPAVAPSGFFRVRETP